MGCDAEKLARRLCLLDSPFDLVSSNHGLAESASDAPRSPVGRGHDLCSEASVFGVEQEWCGKRHVRH